MNKQKKMGNKERRTRRRLSPMEFRRIYKINDFLLGSGLERRDIEIMCPSDQHDRVEIVYRHPVTGKEMLTPDGEPFRRSRLLFAEDGQAKYLSPVGGGVHLYFPVGVTQHLEENPEDTVFITEGEKKAVAAWKYGIPCIALGGIWSWNAEKGSKELHPDFDLIPGLKDREIVTVYDSDGSKPEKVEEFNKCWEQFQAACLRKGIRRVERCILPDITENGKTGLDDFLLKRSPGQFRTVVDKQRIYFDLKDCILTAPVFSKTNFPPLRMIVSPWLSESSLVMIYGEAGVGKSLFTYGLVEAITREKPTEFLGWKTPRRKKVIVIDGEMAGQYIQMRIKKCGLHDRKDVSILSVMQIARQRNVAVNLTSNEWRVRLTKELEASGARVVILDNIASLLNVSDENDAGSWSEIDQWLCMLRNKGFSVILVHHASKSGKQRGTSHRADHLDCIIKLVENEGNVKGIFEKTRHFGGADKEPFAYKLVDDGDKFKFESVDVKAKTKARDEKIYKEHLEGKKNKDIAADFGITPSRVTQIVKEIENRNAADGRSKSAGGKSSGDKNEVAAISA